MLNDIEYSNSKEKFFLISLLQINGIGNVIFKKLLQLYNSAENIFNQKVKDLCNISGIGPFIAKQIINKQSHSRTEKLIKYCRKSNITILTISDENYPHKLKNISEAPPILFYKGNLKALNHTRILSIVGTRQNTFYGKNFINTFIKDLNLKYLTIVSGLARGIDFFSHEQCIKYNIPTIGVLPCAIDEVYPIRHNKLVNKILGKNGGILSEYSPIIRNEKYCFPARNKIIAGISDATLVVEAAEKSGALLTAEYAKNYNKKVFALPGNINNSQSKGCNNLISSNRAIIFTNIKDFIKNMNWISNYPPKKKDLNIEFTKEEKLFIDIFKKFDSGGINIEILKSLVIKKLHLNNEIFNNFLLKFEMKKWIEKLPGNKISLSLHF